MKKILKFLLAINLSSITAISVSSCTTPLKEDRYKLPEIDNIKYSNKFHAQNPTTGMMNDIQGGFYRDGKWHVYFLQNADGIFDKYGYNHGKFGSVWYHVTTTDWINWSYEGPAVPKYTTPYGDQASGTFYEDKENYFGYGSDAIIAITTSYSDQGQNIMMFYSVDGGYKFQDIIPEPILWNPHANENENFRDPYFFVKDNKFILYIAEDDSFGVWVSDKPTSGYKKTGNYKASHPMLECPNLYQLKVEGEETKKWVLLYGGNGGWGVDKDDLSTGSYYQVGELDENFVFTPDKNQKSKRIDFGPDYYAAKFMNKSYKNTDLESLYTSAWVSNWAYNFAIPNDGRLGNMSLVREIKLKNFGDAKKPNYEFITTYQGFGNKNETLNNKYLSGQKLVKDLHLNGTYYKAVFEMGLNDEKLGPINLVIGDSNYKVEVKLDFENEVTTVNRSIDYFFVNGDEEFKKTRTFKLDLERISKKLNIEIYLDKTILELKLPDGKVYTMLKFVSGDNTEDMYLETKNQSSNILKYYQL
ncbi:levanbiose-producing levanase [Spiroplasma helicoides]|uniref:Levanbiose-producing levanase n=1 Tax=Spiroplasma helicoides TaxID=216938 RepID=A0A1B3SJY1_9MOLU|nr:glycoside hydrolase family 32 protein [Spiroplasma helicoides]AOG60228.1 levanbiose-producing levanase [Spiroplasma helicoides]